MKPARFEYAAPASLDEALALLAEHGDEAKILAGGQSLGPLMNLRLASPTLIVDINRVRDLDDLSTATDHVAVGALVRQRTAEQSTLVAGEAPLLGEALHSVGHLGVRNRGTVAGSIAHADPAAEMPAVLTALGGHVRAVSQDGDRLIPATSLFETYFTTALGPEEMITQVLFPRWPPRSGHAWLEFAQRRGDYAMVGVGAVVTLDETGVCRSAALVCTGVDSVPYDAGEAAEMLVGSTLAADDCVAVGDRVARECHPGTDAFADAAYRRRLVR